MTFLLMGRTVLALLVAGAQVAARPAPNQKLLDLMAEGKAETDLGRYDAAIRALSAIVDAPDAPPSLRDEALIRLGVARRGAGDFEGGFKAFDRVSKASRPDRETKALLVQALGGALPGAERWAEIWARVSFAPDRTDPRRPTLAISWPEVARTRSGIVQGGTKLYRGKPLTLRQEGDLQDLFRLIADVSGLNVVVNPGVHGRFAARFENEPWDKVLDGILSLNGYAYRWEDNVLRIARPEHLPRPRRFSGPRIDLDWGTSGRAPGRDLREGLEELAAAGGATVIVDPGVEGNVVLKLNQVRWDQAFDIVVSINDLDWSRDGDTLKVFPKKASAKSR
jgi:tetratricopeptide (TPR) repeat protein